MRNETPPPPPPPPPPLSFEIGPARIRSTQVGLVEVWVLEFRLVKRVFSEIRFKSVEEFPLFAEIQIGAIQVLHRYVVTLQVTFYHVDLVILCNVWELHLILPTVRNAASSIPTSKVVRSHLYRCVPLPDLTALFSHAQQNIDHGNV